MFAEQDQHWLRIRLRTTTATDRFLATVIRPYIATVLQTGMADSFSFSRQNGDVPALRLYVKGQADVLRHILQPNIKGHFKHYLPEDAIHCAPYVPQLDRYGGPTGHFLSMLQYRASSEMVLEQLHRHAAYWNSSRALDIARRLHLQVVARANFSLTHAAEFFGQLHTHLRYETAPSADPVSRYDGVAEHLFDTDGSWWHTLLSAPPTDEHWRRWDSMQQIIGNSLERALVRGKLRERPAADLLRGPQRGNYDRTQLWSYYADFVRLTNNRLGLRPADENYLFYSLMRSLRMLALAHGDGRRAVAV